jgi:oxalate decarboxylase/phosphoglucose isomerase-like protein (cupin superfamily)
MSTSASKIAWQAVKDTSLATKPDFVNTPETIETIISDWVTAKVMSEPKSSGVKAMSAVSIFFAAGQGHARHNHPDAEQFIFVVSGHGEMMIEDPDGAPVSWPIKAGDLVSIPKGAYHSTFNTGWEPIRILAVYSPAGPEQAMHDGTDFKVFPPGEIAKL